MKNNLRELRKKRGLTQSAIACALGVSQNSYSYLETGRVKLDGETLCRLADYFQVSTDCILGRTPPVAPSLDNIPEQSEILNGEYSSDCLNFRVRESGMESYIFCGDIVTIRLQGQVRNDEIAAVFVNGNAVTLRKLKWEQGGLWLIPANSAHSPVFYPKREYDENIRILGKVVEVRRRLE